MKAKHTDLEKLEQLYKESGNQPVVLCSTEGEAVKRRKSSWHRARIEGASSASATGTSQ